MSKQWAGERIATGMVYLHRVRSSVVAKNAAVLYLLQAAGYILPLLVLPYLARVLRPTGWGLVLLAQSFAAWLTLLVEYGFNLWATRAVAQRRAEPHLLGEIVAGVQGAKALLSIAALLIVAVSAAAVPTFRLHPDYALWTGAIAVAYGFSPLWYFQGVERMRAPVSVDVAGRVLASAGIFVWVKQPADGWIVLALQAAAGALTAGVATVWLYKEIPARRPHFAEAIRTLREAASLFMFRGASGVYTLANSFILGILTTTQAVAYYGAGEKIVRAAISLLEPVSQALYPRISHLAVHDRRRAAHVVRQSLIALTVLGTLIGGLLAWLAPVLIRFVLGPGYDAAVPVLQVLALLLPVVAVGTVLGIQWALPLGLDRPFYHLVLAAGALNIVLAVLLAPRYGAVGMAVSVVLAQVLVSLGLVRISVRNRTGLRRSDREKMRGPLARPRSVPAHERV